MTKKDEIMDLTIPPCGHRVCGHGFMGCMKAYREKIGAVEAPWEQFVPGSTVRLRRLSRTGFPQRDWEVVREDVPASE